MTVFISPVDFVNLIINFFALPRKIFLVIGGIIFGGVVDALQAVLILLAIFNRLVGER